MQPLLKRFLSRIVAIFSLCLDETALTPRRKVALDFREMNAAFLITYKGKNAHIRRMLCPAFCYKHHTVYTSKD